MGARANRPASWEACIDGLYESVGEEDAFAPALGRLRPFFDAQSVTLLTTHERAAGRLHIAACGVPAGSLVEYHSHFFMHDEWLKATWARAGMQEGAAYRGNDLVPRRELMKSYFWKEFLFRYGIIDIAAAVVQVQHENTPASVITFHRFAGQSPYPPSVVPRLRDLVPHLRRCLKLHRRLAPQLAIGSTLIELFHEAAAPLLLLAVDGNVIEANRAAQNMLDQNDSVIRRDANGCLMYRSQQGWSPMQAEIAGLGEHDQKLSPSRIALAAPGATMSLHLVQGALSDRLVVHRVTAICSVAVDGGPACASKLRSKFGLTIMETRVATLLMDGRSVTEIAKELASVPATIRTHLQALFAKTGTRRQGQLVSVLMNGA